MALPRIPRSHPRYISHKPRSKDLVHGMSKSFPFLDNIVGAIEYEIPGFKDIISTNKKHQDSGIDNTNHGSTASSEDINRMSGTLDAMRVSFTNIADSVEPLAGLLKTLIKHVDDVAVETRVIHNLMRIINGYNKENYEFMRGMFKAGKERERDKDFAGLVEETRFKKEMGTHPVESPQQVDKEEEKQSMLGGLLGKLPLAGVAATIGSLAGILGSLVAVAPALFFLGKGLEAADKEKDLDKKIMAGGEAFGKATWEGGERVVGAAREGLEGLIKKSDLAKILVEMVGNSVGVLLSPIEESIKTYVAGGDWKEIVLSGVKALFQRLGNVLLSLFDLVTYQPNQKDGDRLSDKISKKAKSIFSSVKDTAAEGKYIVEGKTPEEAKKLVAQDKAAAQDKIKNFIKPVPKTLAKPEVPTAKTTAPKVTKKDNSVEKTMKVKALDRNVNDYKYKSTTGAGKTNQNNTVNAPITQNNRTNNIIASGGTRNPNSQNILRDNVSL